MSADNGIYILETLLNDGEHGVATKEYRVQELQAIERLYYNRNAPDPLTTEYGEDHEAYQNAYRERYYSRNPDVLIENARKMWEGCVVYSTKDEALYAAGKLEENNAIHEISLEYGIQVIRIARVF